MQGLLQTLGATSDATKKTLLAQHWPGRLLLLLRQASGYVLGVLLYILGSS